MSVDTPARIAVLGAGPVGLEAALYGRFLGYDVDVYELGEVADAVRRWGHVRMFTPFQMNRSSLGLAALHAQDERYQPPAADALLTGQQWRDAYLLPLSQTDLLASHLHLGTEVLAVGKQHIRKADHPADADRGCQDFRLLLRDGDGRERIDSAQVVLDTTGVWNTPNYLGNGGIPARGEVASQPHIEYGLPDVLSVERDWYAGHHTLVVGSGCSAAWTVVALRQLAAEADATRITWMTSRPAGTEPIVGSELDAFPTRLKLAQEANQLALQPPPNFTYWPASYVEGIHWSSADSAAAFQLELSGQHAGTFMFDRVVANVGHRGNQRLTSELHVRNDWQTNSLPRAGAAMDPNTQRDHPAPAASESSDLVHPEANFYILGAKSYLPSAHFQIVHGLKQIRDLFAIIGGRDNLDLYATMKVR